MLWWGTSNEYPQHMLLWRHSEKYPRILAKHSSISAPVWTVEGTHRGWSGVVKVSCILCHRGIQLILANSWARPAILVAGKVRGGFLLFLHFLSCSSFFSVPLLHLHYYPFISSSFLWEMTQNDPQRLTCCQTPTQSKVIIVFSS